MLVIKTLTRSIEWHVGEPKPKMYGCEFIYVQADGDELAYIINQFQNVPFNRLNKVQIWKGEFAQFIGDNL